MSDNELVIEVQNKNDFGFPFEDLDRFAEDIHLEDKSLRIEPSGLQVAETAAEVSKTYHDEGTKPYQVARDMVRKIKDFRA
jgi:predicted double-glycine peptidase